MLNKPIFTKLDVIARSGVLKFSSVAHHIELLRLDPFCYKTISFMVFSVAYTICKGLELDA